MGRISMFLVAVLIFFFPWMPSYGQWTQSPGAVGSINCFADSGTSLYAGTSNGLLLSTDHGESWQSLINWGYAAGTPQIRAVAILGSDIFAAVGGYEWGDAGHGIIRSTDGGYNWAPVNGGLNDSSVVSFAVLDSNIFASTYSLGIFRSSDSGKEWLPVNTGLIYSFNDYIPIVKSGDKLFTGTTNGIFLTTNSGLSWSKISSELTQGFVAKLSANNANLVGVGNKMFSSTNSGMSWSLISDTMPSNDPGQPGLVLSDNRDDCSLALSGNNLFAAVSEPQLPQVFLSTDIGSSWRIIDYGTPDRVNALVISGPNLVAGTTVEGIWYEPLSDFNLGSVATDNIAPSSIQISPNPTSSLITIRGGAESVLHVSVANVLGSQVAGSGDRVPGSGEISLDLSKLPPGTYFVRITTPEGMVLRKVVKE
jgi:hypothetical protein